MIATDAANGRTALQQRWRELKAELPHLRARDGASLLGVSEAELAASHPETVALTGDWGRLVEALPGVGPLMALTRNHAVVIEKTGPVEDVEIYRDHAMGQVVGEHIDLRLFLRHWRYGFAVQEQTRSGLRHSLQFFDAHGVAVHKLYRVAETHVSAYQALVEDFRATATIAMGIQSEPPPEEPIEDGQVDHATFRDAWLAMNNTHEFFALLRRFKLQREQALRLAGGDLAYPVPRHAHRDIFHEVQDRRLPVMIFVSNRGTVQIHTGPIVRLETAGQWFNVLDPSFNLHLHEPSVARAWVVCKPLGDGFVTSLECYDAGGQLLMQCFGKRKSGETESLDWQAVLQHLRDAQNPQ